MKSVIAGLFLLAVASPAFADGEELSQLSCEQLAKEMAAVVAAAMVPGAGEASAVAERRQAIEAAAAAKGCALG